MRRFLAVLTALACLAVPAMALGAGGGEDNLLFNGDFSQYADSAALPAGWEMASYAAAEAGVYVGEDDEAGAYVSIENFSGNDTRITQLAEAEPETCYLVSARVRTSNVSGGTGANLSIDNYDIDGTYCYSENLFGSSDWQTLSMYVRTGPEQTRLCVAMRLGGYGTTAVGAADFANVSLTRCDPPAGAEIIDLMTSNGHISAVSADAESDLSTAFEHGNGGFAAIIAAFVLTALLYALLYRRCLCYGGAGMRQIERRDASLTLAAVLAGAFLFRMILSRIFFGHPTDINCFMAWGEAMQNLGPSGFYTSGMFADYPPGYMYVCAAISGLCRLLGVPYGSDLMALLFKLPATVADLLSAYLVYRIAKKNGVAEPFALVLAGLLAFNPVLMFVSGAWGQIDTLLTLLLVASCYLLQAGKRIPAGAVYGLAILLKPQALMLGPLLAAAFLADVFSEDWKRKLRDTLLAVLAALAVLYLGALPCRGTQPWYWLVQKYFATASSYPYASIEAFNFASLIGGNWKAIGSTSILGIPYAIFGTGMIVLAVAFSIFLYLKGFKRSSGALYLSGAVMILLIYTFGHYMHERYMLPAILLLLMAYLYYRDRRILVAFGAVTASSLLNVTAAMYIINKQGARGAFYSGITAVGSAVAVLACLYTAYVAFSILYRDAQIAPLDAPVIKAAADSRKARQPILPAGPTDDKLHLTKRDILTVLAVTLVYGVVALTNLGTLHAPETCWEANTPGESVTLTFPGPTHVAEYWVYGNIGTGGTLLVSADGYEGTFQQTYDDMFRWKPVTADFTTDSVTLSLYSGSFKLNEAAFFDADGNRLPVTVARADGGGANIADEQDTVPDVPSYYNGMYFDELYHGRTAYEHLHNLAPYENSHPPLGKLFIMLGVAVFGMNPFGWRVVGALFGVAMLPIFYCFGKRLLKDSRYALLVTVLFAADFMHFTQTRIATIDVYAVFFVLLMYDYMYRYVSMNFYVDGLKRTLKPLALAGLFFGIGAASKWTCIYAGAGLAVLLFLSLLARYREYARAMASGTKAEKAAVAPFFENMVKTLLWCCVFYIAVPVTVYYLSYLPYYIYEASGNSAYGFFDTFKTLWNYQEFMYRYHSGLNATHPYQSAWYAWPFTLKPMWYYFNSYAGGRFVSTISASGNPAVWWVSAVGSVTLLGLRIGKRIDRDRALEILCVGVLANYLPWVLVTRCTFIYHFFSTVPFLILAAAYALQAAEKKDPAVRYVKWVWMGAAVLFFLLLYPGLSGFAVSPEWAAFLKNLPGGKLMYGA